MEALAKAAANRLRANDYYRARGDVTIGDMVDPILEDARLVVAAWEDLLVRYERVKALVLKLFERSGVQADILTLLTEKHLWAELMPRSKLSADDITPPAGSPPCSPPGPPTTPSST